jgi:hypothetical protein
MDCFASLAMTIEDVKEHSRGAFFARAMLQSAALEIRGRRECRALAAPAASHAKQKSARAKSPQAGRSDPALPAQWF